MNPRDGTAGDGNEEAAWRELVARFDVPTEEDDAIVPWPERENLRAWPPGDPATGRARVIRPAEPGEQDSGAESDPASAGPAPPAASTPQGSSTPSATPVAATDDEHFVPPPPPPLPKLDGITKGAWVALFGGPAYLLLAASLSWSVPGWLAFCAVAAFVGGFVTLVVRMGDGPPDGSDDGAVV